MKLLTLCPTKKNYDDNRKRACETGVVEQYGGNHWANESNTPPAWTIHYVKALSYAPNGWTKALKKIISRIIQDFSQPTVGEKLLQVLIKNKRKMHWLHVHKPKRENLLTLSGEELIQLNSTEFGPILPHQKDLVKKNWFWAGNCCAATILQVIMGIWKMVKDMFKAYCDSFLANALQEMGQHKVLELNSVTFAVFYGGYRPNGSLITIDHFWPNMSRRNTMNDDKGHWGRIIKWKTNELLLSTRKPLNAEQN